MQRVYVLESRATEHTFNITGRFIHLGFPTENYQFVYTENGTMASSFIPEFEYMVIFIIFMPFLLMN